MMMTSSIRKSRAAAQAGFSLIELMVVILILSVIMGAVFQQIDLVQKRFRSEENKLDMFQTAREFLDQMVRDIHQAGFPNLKMYQPGTVTGTSASPTYNADSAQVATGLWYIGQSEVRFEGDVDFDGQVDEMRYKLFPASANAGDENCPCIRRSQLLKADGTMPTAQNADYRTQVENLTTTTSNIFAAYDKQGTVVDTSTALTKANFDPSDNGAKDVVNSIWAVQISITVQAATGDIGTGVRPQVFLTAAAQVNN
jgi:prepilin-type N-terminal cleavage/methylation domain-containing protein